MKNYFVVFKVRGYFTVAGGIRSPLLKSDNLVEAILEFAEIYWMDFMSMNPRIKIDVKKIRAEIEF